MTKKQFRTRLWLLIVISLLLCAMVGVAVGKYIQTVSVSGKVTFSAKLAKSITLQEHSAVQQSDGSYVLSTEFVTENETQPQMYILLPGLDIPKDPHIVMEGKTSIPAYLFVEVVDNTTNEALDYELTTDWKILDGLAGKHGGKVYVYTPDGTEPAQITTDLSVYILENNQVTVNQGLNRTETNDALTFYAAMGETALGTTAEEVYNAIS